MKTCKEKPVMPLFTTEERAGFRIPFAKNSPQESQTSSLYGLQISDVQWALNEENSALLGVTSPQGSSGRLTLGF